LSSGDRRIGCRYFCGFQGGWLVKVAVPRALAPLTGCALVCAVSTVWSVFPSWTLYKSLEYLVDITCLAAIVTLIRSAHGYKAFLDWSWTLCGLLVGSVWLGVLLWPSLALQAEQGTLSRPFSARGETTSQLYTLSSRMDWWGLAWQALEHHRWTGLVLGPATDSARSRVISGTRGPKHDIVIALSSGFQRPLKAQCQPSFPNHCTLNVPVVSSP
jgi:hypothetical protein